MVGRCRSKLLQLGRCELQQSDRTVLKLKLRNPYDYYSERVDKFQLEGKISSSLLELKYLEYLDLSVNNFNNSIIPKFLCLLENLRYLNLSYSLFSGLVPPHLGNLSSLHYLDFSNNYHLEVESLEWLMSLPSLKHLNLDMVDLTKAGPDWLKAVNMLPSLLELHLSYCRLSVLPLLIDTHSINFTSLSTLDLSCNHFDTSLALPPWLYNLSGLINLQLKLSHLNNAVISNEIGKLVQLQHLHLSMNNIGGQLPSGIGNLRKLIFLDLSVNSFRSSVPGTIGMLTPLRFFYLYSNQMKGTVGEAISQLPNLRELDLSNNPWQGSLSEIHFEKHTKLHELDLSTTADGNLIMDVRHHTNGFLLFRKSIRLLGLGGVKIRSETFPPWIQTLHHLEDLTLSGIVGDIPTEFWKSCTNITRLALSNNAISISTSFKNLEALLPLVPTKLGWLFLDNNSFHGDEIPRNIGELLPSLVSLDPSSSSLSGKIPRSICKLKSLMFLDLSNNLLTGEISNHRWEQMDSLFKLDSSGNIIVGKVPESIGSLRYLLLNDNNLEGEIPTFRNRTSLQVLDLGGNNLTGNIPASFGGNIPDVSLLRLRGNMLSGMIPPELCLISGLTTFDLAQNSFQGVIPQCLGNLSTSDVKKGYFVKDGIKLVSKGREYTFYTRTLFLVHLVDLSDNNLSGNIPQSLMNLTTLQTLNLSMNNLTGEIPSNIGALQKLESLDLSTNQLSGPIPPSIADMSSLSYLNLSHNNLSGRIPSSRQLQTLDETSIFDGNPFLCGLPLSRKCPGEDTPEGEGEGEEKVERGKRGFDLDKWGLILSLISGFLVGFWGVCGSLVLKASWRKAYFGVLEDAKDKITVMVSDNVARLRRRNLQ